MISLFQFIVHALLLCGALALAFSIPSYQLLIDSRELTPSATLGLFGACSDTSNDAPCAVLSDDFFHCLKGDGSFTYSGFFPYSDPYLLASGSDHLDNSSCGKHLGAEAFGIISLVLAIFSFLSSIYRQSNPSFSGAFISFSSSISGILSLVVFFSIKPQYLNNSPTQPRVNVNDWAEWVRNGTFTLGYSFSLQVVGIVCMFIGSIIVLIDAAINGTQTEQQEKAWDENENETSLYIQTYKQEQKTGSEKIIRNDMESQV